MAAVNLFWLDLNYTPTPNVPMSWSTVDSNKKHLFKLAETASFADVPIEIPVLREQVEAEDLGAQGAWRYTSPTEIVVAWVDALASAIAAGASDDELEVWVRHMLTVPALFRLLPSESKIEWRAEQIREDFSQKEGMSRTTVPPRDTLMGAGS